MLAQPSFNGASNKTVSNVNYLIIDNSIGTDRVDANGPVIEQAKTFAKEIIDRYGDEQQWVLASTTGKPVLNQVLTKNEILSRIEKVGSSNQIASIAEFLRLLPKDISAKLIVISDDHLNKWEKALKNQKGGLPHQLDFYYFDKSNTNNVFVANVQLENQVVALNRPIQLRVDVGASGIDRSVNQLVRFVLDGVVQGEYQIELEPNSIKSVSFSINPSRVGFLEGYVELDGDSYLTDNKRFVVLKVPEIRKIAVLAENLETDEDLVYIRALFDAANSSKSDIEFTYLTLNDVEKLKSEVYSGYVLLGLIELPDFLKSIATDWLNEDRGLMVIPSIKSSLRSYNSFFSSVGISARYESILGSFSSPKIISSIDINDQAHPIYNQMFDLKKDADVKYEQPNLFAYYSIKSNSSRFSNPILTSQTGESIVLEERVSKSKVLISGIGSGSAWSNLASNPLFAPFWYKAAWYVSIPTSGGLFSHELGLPINEFIIGSSTNLLFVSDDKYAEKPAVEKKGGKLIAKIDTYDISLKIISLKQDDKVVASTGLYIPMEYSDFKKSTNEEWNLFFSKHFKDVNVYDVNTNTYQNVLAQSSINNFELWPVLAVLGIILLIAESLVIALFKS